MPFYHLSGGRSLAPVLISLLASSAVSQAASVRSEASDPTMLSQKDDEYCRAYLQAPEHSQAQEISAETLARIRDIGDDDAQPPFAIAPDGQSIAFAMRRGDPDRNINCQGIYSLALKPGARPIYLASAGPPKVATSPLAGLAGFPNGYLFNSQVRWSPDGDGIAYLKQNGGESEIWTVAVDGGAPHRLLSLNRQIEDFAWGPDGRSMLFVSDPTLAEAEVAIDREAAHGYLYDDRSFPLGRARPFPALTAGPIDQVIDLSSGSIRPAKPDERAWLAPEALDAPKSARSVTKADASHLAWRSADTIDATRIVARIGGKSIDCKADVCEGNLAGPWWSADRRHILFAQRRDGLSRFFSWNPLHGQPKLLRAEDARYIGCRSVSERLICLRDDPATPFQIVTFDLRSGRHTLLFDPNPEISGQFRGSIERRVWTSPEGVETFGHLILPPGYRRDRTLPLIVVQYRASGFQRGGVGDEAPILPLANDGYAVLNFDRPNMPGKFSTVAAYQRAAIRDWQDERTTLSALKSGVRRLVDQGIVDPTNMGIYGLSAGSQAAQFALIHTNLFKAVSFGTCCKDSYGFMIENGPAYRHLLESWGLAPADPGNEAQWKPVSLARNAATIKSAILMQLPEWEYRSALEAVTALKAHHDPVELQVFPGEYHIKNQPAHRLAIYRRNIDWFDYWLRDRRNEPLDPDQYARWDRLKAQLRDRTP